MFALVVNDDGIQAEGIAVLAETARRFFDRVVVVAPRGQTSAMSQAITLNRSFRVFEQAEDRYAVEGTPADCVFYAVRELLDNKPDMVLSGINLGPNVGYDTLYSGTVAAAREAILNGIPAVSFSLGVTRPVSFEQAGAPVAMILQEVLRHGIPDEVFLNVNIPSRELFGEPKGVRFCGLGRRVFKNRTATWVDPKGGRHGWIGGRELALDGDDDSDCWWLGQSYVTVSALTWDSGCANIGELKDRVSRLNDEWPR